MRKVLVFALLLVLACKGREEASRGAAAPKTETGTEVGATMPDYSAMWLDGSKFELASRRDKVVLLNLWATWCGPCRFEIPELEKLHAQYGPKGFEVIGVSVDEGGVETVRQFVQENKMTYPIVLDAEAKIADILQASVLPTTLLLDRDGRIVWKQLGPILANDEKLTKAIQAAL